MKAGPALLLNCPTLQADGSYPLNYFGWYSTMLVYDVEKRPFVYEERYRQGYEVNNRLRRGAKLTFNWSNKGLHVGMFDEPRKDPDTLKVAVGLETAALHPQVGRPGEFAHREWNSGICSSAGRGCASRR